MAANKLIDVSKLNEALVIYDQALRALPLPPSPKWQTY